MYSRDDVERLVSTWDSGYSLETAEARADLTRARATLPEYHRTALSYLCQGYPPKEVARLMGISLTSSRMLVNDTLTRLVRGMNATKGAA